MLVRVPRQLAVARVVQEARQLPPPCSGALPVSYKDALVEGVAKGAKKGARLARQGKAGKAPDAAEADSGDDEEKEVR